MLDNFPNFLHANVNNFRLNSIQNMVNQKCKDRIKQMIKYEDSRGDFFKFPQHSKETSSNFHNDEVIEYASYILKTYIE